MPFMYKSPSTHAVTPFSNPNPAPSLPPQPPPPPPPPLPRHELHHYPSMLAQPQRIMLAAASWLGTRRSRCLFLLLCSPLLLPFLCAIFPILCAIELCIRLCRRRRSSRIKKNGDDYDDGSERLRRCEEGFCDCCREENEVGLLQRYLEDQLRLVGSVYECGGDDQHQEENTQNLDYTIQTPLLG